jgi:hypothetical protein
VLLTVARTTIKGNEAANSHDTEEFEFLTRITSLYRGRARRLRGTYVEPLSVDRPD